MKTQDSDTIGAQPAPQPSPRSRGRRWLAGLGALIVVALIIGISSVVFAQLGQQHNKQGRPASTPIPPTGQWQQVLKGYTINSFVAARGNPSVLYACATITSGGNVQGSPGSITLLHSSDLGTHWQDLGKAVTPSLSCQVLVSPTNSNEVYVVTSVGNTPSPEVLKHSTDGGQTWETIHPTFRLPASPSPVPWYVQQIQIEGNRLFALQWTPLGRMPYVHQPPYGIISRLITSSDGGHNWTVFDSQLSSTHMSTIDYAVDPSNTSTVYELLGIPWLPPIEKVEPATTLPRYAQNEQLYKTADGGTTWHQLLNNLPFGAQIQIASSKPQVLYVGGTISPSPLAGVENPSLQPGAAGSFNLRMSSDGGTTWRDITPYTDMFGLHFWFVSANGQVYLSGYNSGTGGQPTPISGTAVPATVQPTTPKSSIIDGNGAQVKAKAPMVGPASTAIQRYDPAAARWSNVTNAPAMGALVQVTPVNTSAGSVLWFMGISNKQVLLYRYVV